MKMRFGRTLSSIVLAGACLFGSVGKARATPVLYDDFSAPTLNASKWGVRQDYEGWQMMEEHGLDVSSQNFHTKQNNLGNAGTFLVPKYQFISGDIFEYDVTYSSGEGNRVSNVFVNSQNRFGTVGVWNSPQIDYGTYHVKLEFGEDWIRFNDTNIYTLSTSAPFEVYIGTRTGHNGTGHFDYDNFYIDKVPEPATIGLLGVGGLALLRRKDGRK